jgi:hypothetical protein
VYPNDEDHGAGKFRISGGLSCSSGKVCSLQGHVQGSQPISRFVFLGSGIGDFPFLREARRYLAFLLFQLGLEV